MIYVTYREAKEVILILENDGKISDIDRKAALASLDLFRLGFQNWEEASEKLKQLSIGDFIIKKIEHYCNQDKDTVYVVDTFQLNLFGKEDS